MKKRVLSLFMAFVLCLTLLPMAALAEEPDGGNEAPAVETVDGENAPDGAVAAAQALIDALPDADALDDMDADELDAAYADIQAAYEAYEALTSEQQALLTGADCFEELFGWFNEQTAPLADASATPDDIDANGDIIKGSIDRTGPVLTADDRTLSGQYYIVQGNVTISGDLTVDGSTDGGLVLGKGAKLTVNGALICTGGNNFYIYGQSNNGADAGELIINHTGDGAAVRSASTSAPRLGISSGKVTISSSGELVDNVVLYSTKPMHEGILDGDVLSPSEWGKSSISGGELVIEYCGHDHADYTPSGDTQHIKSCTQCGFNTGNTTKVATCGDDGYERYVSAGEEGHRKECPCGNQFGTVIEHAIKTVPTHSKTHHTTGCQFCDYTSGTPEEHDYDADGECTKCGFKPIAQDGYLSSYDSLKEAMDEASKIGNVKDALVTLYSKAEKNTVIDDKLVFNYPGKTLTLNMNGYTLEHDFGPVITVEAGTLVVKGAATINQTAQSKDLVAPAIKVTGGELIFEDTLNVTGSAHSDAAAPAILIEGGTVTFEKDVTATAPENAGLNTAIAPAVKVTGGKAVFNGKLTAVGGLGGVSKNTRPCEPAVYANGGELEFNGDLDLNGGLTITGSAQLTKGLSQGTFKVDYSGETVNGARVSVEGANNYKYLEDLLADGYALVDDETSRYLVGSYTSWPGNATILAHEHTWAKPASGDIYECTGCGASCAHEGGYATGKCEVCGKPCPHDIADQSPTDHHYYCNDCHQKMAARIQTDTYKWAHYTDLADALAAAENGQTVMLLDDIDNTGKYAILTGDDKTVTLDLHGYTINGGWMQIGIDRNWNNYTSSTLKVTGTGSIKTSGNLSVGYLATLDLSGWTGSEIAKVGMQKNGKIESNPESLLIVGENIGTIGTLGFYSWPSAGVKTKLNGGSYGEISIVVQYNSEPFGSLLAPGYAFQYIDSGKFVEYTKTATNQGNTISNVKVVRCPHEKIENGTCAYCGKTGIAATLGTEIYTESNIAQAFNYDWQTIDGATLTLHQDCSVGNIGWYGVYNGTLDLNGHTLTMAENTSIEVSGGSSVTVVDSSENGGGKLNGRVWISSGSLTLESGEITSLDVSNMDTDDVTVKLRGGTVKVTSANIPIYKLLEEGYYLLNGSVPVEPIGNFDTSVTYTVQRADITVASGITGEIAISKNRVPISMTVFAGDRSLKYVQFQWYLLQDDGSLVQLTKSADEELYESDDDYVTVYDCNKPYGKEFASAWSGLEKGKKYNLICVLTGKDDSGDKWHTVLKDCTMTMLPPSVEDAEITFAPGWQVKTFWPDLDNNSVGKTEISSALGAYTVTLGGQTLKEGTDYTVSGNVATGIGLQELTITGIEPNYSGTKTVQWTVVAHKLKMLEIKQSEKQYDGTVDLPDGAFSEYFNSNDNYGQITLKEGTDYVVTDARFDTPDASSENKGYRYTVELKNPNYVFADGTRVHTAVYGEDAHTTVSITKADAPAAESGALTILNNHAYTYTVDLPALPALTSPMEYGEVSYTINWVDLGSYYNVTKGEAKIENGKLILPIQAVATKTEGSIGEVAVMVSSTNIADFALIINVSATNKIVPTGAPTLSKTTLVWDEALTDITLSGTMRDEENGKDVTGTFAWDGANTISGIGKLSMAWTFTPDDTNTYTEAKGSSEVEVVKATPAGAPKYTAITASGKTLADAALTTEGGTFSIPGTVQWVDADGNALAGDTEVKANTAYKWRFVPEDAEHYNELTGSITLYSVSTGGGGSSGSTTTKTETTTDPDGTTTKTETKSDGSTVETVTKPDGSTTTTETKTETKPDGSTTTTETKSETNADGTKTETKSETTTAADGSKTETKSETKTEADGTKSETKAETKTDANGVTSGTETTKTTAPNGSTGTTTTTTENGNTKIEAEAKISEKAVEDAKKSGEAVKVPTEVKAGENYSSAPTVKVELPKDAGETKIEIPVEDVNSGTVAVIVHEDGTEELVKSSAPTEDGIQLVVDGSATIKIVDNSKDFRDTRDHWSRDEVNFIASREIFNGIGNNLFGVGQPMTRGMVNTVLARLAGVDTTPKSGQRWYEVGTEWAKNNGITDGSNPEASVTREQLAAMLYRFSGTPEVSGNLQFNDAREISDYAENALLWAVQNGILNGVGDNRVAPKNNAERAQVAAMMARYLKNVG